MKKEMTPCEKLGYRVGDKFELVEKSYKFDAGDVVYLQDDDGTGSPYFTNESVKDEYPLGVSCFLSSIKKVAKLKPAKQALADAIRQNGGWRNDAAIAIFGKYSMECAFVHESEGSVKYNPEIGSWQIRNENYLGGFKMKPFANWHQTILIREEYYQAYPKADADGWIEWKGGECPVEASDEVDTKHRVGRVDIRRYANSAWWYHTGGHGDIIAYRLHKPEVGPEFCESVMRSIPEPEAKPTIEQLAQDYRNAKDYALRLQKEANEAAVKAESFTVEIRKKLLELQELIG